MNVESIQSGHTARSPYEYCRHSEDISSVFTCLKGVFVVGAGYTNALEVLGQWYTSC